MFAGDPVILISMKEERKTIDYLLIYSFNKQNKLGIIVATGRRNNDYRW